MVARAGSPTRSYSGSTRQPVYPRTAAQESTILACYNNRHQFRAASSSPPLHRTRSRVADGKPYGNKPQWAGHGDLPQRDTHPGSRLPTKGARVGQTSPPALKRSACMASLTRRRPSVNAGKVSLAQAANWLDG